MGFKKMSHSARLKLRGEDDPRSIGRTSLANVVLRFSEQHQHGRRHYGNRGFIRFAQTVYVTERYSPRTGGSIWRGGATAFTAADGALDERRHRV